MLTMLKSSLSALLFCLLPTATLLAAPPLQADLPVLKLAMYHSPPYYFTENVPEPYGLSLDLLKPAAHQLHLHEHRGHGYDGQGLPKEPVP